MDTPYEEVARAAEDLHGIAGRWQQSDNVAVIQTSFPRWKDSTVALLRARVSIAEAEQFEKLPSKPAFVLMGQWEQIVNTHDAFLGGLLLEIQKNPAGYGQLAVRIEQYSRAQKKKKSSSAPPSPAASSEEPPKPAAAAATPMVDASKVEDGTYWAVIRSLPRDVSRDLAIIAGLLFGAGYAIGYWIAQHPYLKNDVVQTPASTAPAPPTALPISTKKDTATPASVPASPEARVFTKHGAELKNDTLSRDSSGKKGKQYDLH